jgi:phosphoserine phosphatase RsbU/P
MFEPSSHPATVEEVLVRVQEVLAVEAVAVLILDSAGLHLRLTSSRGLDAPIEHAVRVPISSSFAGRIVASGSPLRMQHQDCDADGAVDSVLWQQGVQSLLGVPLLAGRRTIGVLYVGSQDARPFSDTEVLALQTAADRVVTVLTDERSVAERAAARTLQESLLPTELPRVDGLEFASRFVAAEEFGVGGDWFDVFPLPDRQIGVVIGDVAGSGLRAAVVMGRLRSALRAYAIESDTPSEALTRLDRKFTHFEPNEMATILYLTVAQDLQRITVSSTGHPPPVIAHPDGATHVLDCSPSAPIGAHVPTTRVDVECPLRPGTTVVCYTDGLIERRREPLNVGLQRLRNAVFAGPPDAVCAKIMTEMIGSQVVQDDTALLAFRRTS